MYFIPNSRLDEIYCYYTKENGKIVTSNPDKGNHGFGLRNIDEILKKYNGTSKIDIDNGVFTITTALYIK